jgi:ATPase subunit of ABC transporter with duplicated ATPase domains
MPYVCAERLGFSYSDRVRVLDDVDLRLSPGWYGLVAANGLGKTTLARLIAGELRPTAGRIWLEPENATVVLCRQEVDQLAPELVRFARDDSREACRQRGLLALDRGAIDRWNTLSPGERKRWQLAAALAACPDVLIVDEPTNHLDAHARDYLIHALQHFRGIGIAVSHDRELLATLTSSTLRIHAGTLESYPVSYAQAKELWETEADCKQEHRERLLQKKQRIEQRIDATNRDKVAVHKSRSARSRMKNIHDHDGSSFARTGRAAMAEANISRRLRVMAADLARASERLPDFAVDKTVSRSLFLGYDPAPMPRLLAIDGEDLYAGRQLVLRDVRAVLNRNARVHLRGENGAGKSTLLMALLARAPAPERLLYLPQELRPDEVRMVESTARSLGRDERGRILSLLATLGVDPERVLGSASLSPGEARKLKLALGLAMHAFALILDEPTNHLDLPAIERVEQALAAFPGAILLVCHDQQFAGNCTNTVWEIRDYQLWTS